MDDLEMLLKGVNFYNSIIDRVVFNVVDWDSAVQIIYYNGDEKILIETYNYLSGDLDKLQKHFEKNGLKVDYMLRIVERSSI